MDDDPVQLHQDQPRYTHCPVNKMTAATIFAWLDNNEQRIARLAQNDSSWEFILVDCANISLGEM